MDDSALIESLKKQVADLTALLSDRNAPPAPASPVVREPGPLAPPKPWEELDKAERFKLVERYRALLVGRRRNERYVTETWNTLQRMMELTDWAIDEDAVTLAIAKMRDEDGRSACTLKRYIVATKSLATWLTRRGHFVRSPLAFLETPNCKVDRRYERVAFTDAELTKLLATTEASPWDYYGSTGVDRARLYLCAAATGLREGTLFIIEAGQFHFDPIENSCVKVRAEQIKDASDLVVPIQRDAAEVLRAYLAPKPPNGKAFRMPPNRWNHVRMIRRDLLAAGIAGAEVTVLDNGKLRRRGAKDFHSLRYTFCTRALRALVPLSTVQRWMGHCDPALTSNIYNSGTIEDDRNFANTVPSLVGGGGGGGGG